MFSVRKLGQFLRALSGLFQCVAVYCHLSTDFGRPDFWLPAVFSLLTLSWPWSTVKDRRRDHATTEEHRGLLCLRAEPLGRAPPERLWGAEPRWAPSR